MKELNKLYFLVVLLLMMVVYITYKVDTNKVEVPTEVAPTDKDTQREEMVIAKERMDEAIQITKQERAKVGLEEGLMKAKIEALKSLNGELPTILIIGSKNK